MKEIGKQSQVCRNALGYLESVHKRLIPRIDLEVLDKNLAMYLLGGRAITLCYSALLLLEKCQLAVIGAIVRMIEETVYLADHFADPPDDAEDLKKWFANKIIAPKKLRESQKSFVENAFGQRDPIFDEAIDEVYRISSKRIHPTYRTTKLNLNVITKEYDYQWTDYQKHDVEIFDSVAQAIVTVINMFLFSKEIYRIGDQMASRLGEIRGMLESLDI